jgi:hypothetical protein
VNFNIDKILSEWAYRIDDGQPNVTNVNHINHLREILYNFGLPHKFIVEYVHGLIEAQTYVDNSQNRSLNRVGKKWGSTGNATPTPDADSPEPKQTKNSKVKTQSKLSSEEIKQARDSNSKSVEDSLMMTKTQAKIQAKEKGKKNVGLGTPESRAGEAMVHSGIDQMVERVKSGKSFEDSLAEVETDFLGMVNSDDHILNSSEGKKWVAAAVATLKKIEKEVGLKNIQSASWDTDAGRQAIGVDPKVNTSSDMFVQMNDGKVMGVSLKKSGKVFILSGGWDKQSKKILNDLKPFMKDAPEEFAQITDAIDPKHHANEAQQAISKATETIDAATVESSLKKLKEDIGWSGEAQKATGSNASFGGSGVPKYIKALEDPELLEKIKKGPKTSDNPEGATKDEQKAYAKLLQTYHTDEYDVIRAADDNATKRLYDQINKSTRAKSAMKQFVIKSLHLPETLGLNQTTKAGGIDDFATFFGSGDDGAILNEETIGTLLGKKFKDSLDSVRSGTSSVQDLNKVIEDQIEFDTEKGMIVFKHENNSEYPLFEMAGRAKGIMASLALEIKQTPLMAYALKAGTFNSDEWTSEERKKFGLEMKGEK